MFRTNFLKDKLTAGGVVIGTWSVVPSAIVVDIIASSGLDFLIIDSEHGPVGFEMAQNMVIACESRGVSPVMGVGGLSSKSVTGSGHRRSLPTGSEYHRIGLLNSIEYPPTGIEDFHPSPGRATTAWSGPKNSPAG